MFNPVDPRPQQHPRGLPPRGHACNICRRRKLKCDGVKPTCTQCSRANRVSDCIYEDDRQTTTQKLSKRIAELQDLVDSYETILATTGNADLPTSPENMTTMSAISSQRPSLSAHSSAEHGRSVTASSPRLRSLSSSGDTMGTAYPSTGHSASYAANTLSWPSQRSSTISSTFSSIPVSHNTSSSQAQRQGKDLSRNNAFGSIANNNQESQPGVDLLFAGQLAEWDTEALPTSVDQRTLLTVFMGHRHQAHFEFIGDSLISSLSLPRNSPLRPHPCLINAIYLFASHFSRSAAIAPYDALFLARAKAGMQAAIAAEDRLLNVIQAGCIVALYLYFKSRVLEGYQLGGAVARLSIACGLHQIRSSTILGENRNRGSLSPATARSGNNGGQEASQTLVNQSPVGVSLPEAASAAELGERIYTFWQVWCVDKYGIMTTGLACSLPDQADVPMLKFRTPLPPQMKDLVRGTVEESDLVLLSSVYQEDSRRPKRSSSHLRESIVSCAMKGVELYAAALDLKHYNPSAPEFTGKYRRIESAIERTHHAMPPLSYHEDDIDSDSSSRDSPEGGTIQPRMIWPHLLIIAARIVLYGTLAHTSEAIYQARLTAAGDAMSLLRETQHYDANYHEVALGSAWKQVAETLLRHVKRLKASGAPHTTIQAFQNEADASTLAMQRICMLFAATVMKSWNSL